MNFKPLLFIFLFLLSSLAFGQKAYLIKARELQSEGSLTEALAAVEEVLQDKDTTGIGGAWFTYAEIHKTLFLESVDQDRQEFHLKSALAGYEKTKLFQPQKTRIYLMADQVQVQLYDDLLRKGTGLFQQQEFEASATAFEQASLVDPKDSIVLQYAASISMQGELYERAVNNYKKLALITPKVSLYQSIIGIQKDRMKNDSLALISIKEARKAYPNQYEFKRYELDIYLKTNDQANAKQLLQQLLQEYPNNAQFALRLAVINDQLYKELLQEEQDSTILANSFMEVVEDYKSALALNAKDITGNFNLAMLYTQNANQFYKAINEFTLTEYKLKSKSYEAMANEQLALALPYIEAAHAIQPKSPDILRSLRNYYDGLDKPDQKREIEAKMKALGINF